MDRPSRDSGDLPAMGGFFSLFVGLGGSLPLPDRFGSARGSEGDADRVGRGSCSWRRGLDAGREDRFSYAEGSPNDMHGRAEQMIELMHAFSGLDLARNSDFDILFSTRISPEFEPARCGVDGMAAESPGIRERLLLHRPGSDVGHEGLRLANNCQPGGAGRGNSLRDRLFLDNRHGNAAAPTTDALDSGVVGTVLGAECGPSQCFAGRDTVLNGSTRQTTSNVYHSDGSTETHVVRCVGSECTRTTMRRTADGVIVAGDCVDGHGLDGTAPTTPAPILTEPHADALRNDLASAMSRVFDLLGGRLR